jgi:hypothetical protein
MDWIEQVKWADDGLVAASRAGPCLRQGADARVDEPHGARADRRNRRSALLVALAPSLWRKGETSGHAQKVREIRLDCDGDAILLLVEQVGGIACHTGRERCFFRRLERDRWVEVEPVLKDPAAIYGHG